MPLLHSYTSGVAETCKNTLNQKTKFKIQEPFHAVFWFSFIVILVFIDQLFCFEFGWRKIILLIWILSLGNPLLIAVLCIFKHRWQGIAVLFCICCIHLYLFEVHSQLWRVYVTSVIWYTQVNNPNPEIKGSTVLMVKCSSFCCHSSALCLHPAVMKF